MTAQDPIVPQVDEDNRPFWEALERGELLVWRCATCAGTFLPPLPGCPHCGATTVAPQPASGTGELENWIVIHRAMSPAFADEVPYVVGAVRLAEGARVFARIHGLEAPSIVAGMPLRFAPLARDGRPMLAFSAAVQP